MKRGFIFGVAAFLLIIIVLILFFGKGIYLTGKVITSNSAESSGIYPLKAYDFSSQLNTFEPWKSLANDALSTGLYAPENRVFSTIDGQPVSSCIVYDFGSQYEYPILVNYTRTQKSINGDGCLSSYCGYFPSLYIYISSDGNNYKFAGYLSDTEKDIFNEGRVDSGQSFRYVMTCRGGGSSLADNLLINYIKLDNGEYRDVYSYHSTYKIEDIGSRIDSYKNSMNFGGLSLSCLTLTSAYKLNPDDSYEQQAKEIGDFLILNKDLDKDGLVGWGDVSATTGTTSDIILPANTSYTVQTGSQIKCLADIYYITQESKYLDVAIKAAEDSWNKGTGNLQGCSNCFYYWYSYNDKDIGRYVRNVNLEMARGLLQLYSVSGIEKYKERALQSLNSEIFELSYNNPGYFSIYDPWYQNNIEHERSRIDDHLVYNALAFYDFQKILKTPNKYDSYINQIMDYWANCKTDYCQASKCSYWTGDIYNCTSAYTLYYCFFRDVSDDMMSKCLYELNKNPEDFYDYVRWILLNNYNERCSQATYSAWDECSQDNIQTRKVLSKYPENCFLENMITSQPCEYTLSEDRQNQSEILNISQEGNITIFYENGTEILNISIEALNITGEEPSENKSIENKTAPISDIIQAIIENKIIKSPNRAFAIILILSIAVIAISIIILIKLIRNPPKNLPD